MEMNCEHGISINHTCVECETKILNQEKYWESKQIRRELATLDQRLVDISRERSAERTRRINAEDELISLCSIITTELASHWPDKSFAPSVVQRLLRMAHDVKSARVTAPTYAEERQ